MIDFKETAKEIFNICTNIAKADGRATEKIEDILKQVYETDRQLLLLTDKGAKKAILTILLYHAGVPKSIMNTTRMQFEPLDVEKIADYLLDNGIEIVNPFSSYIKKMSNGKIYKIKHKKKIRERINNLIKQLSRQDECSCYNYNRGLCYSNGEPSFDEEYIDYLYDEIEHGRMPVSRG